MCVCVCVGEGGGECYGSGDDLVCANTWVDTAQVIRCVKADAI